ncbi:MAG: hypothetical protein CJBNEKGG_04113 [Prosthecobacter sp.]|nr:hypothetical protein [Prosthecobacter sp.]
MNPCLFTRSIASASVLWSCALALPLSGLAGECDDITRDVAAAVSKEPGKVLMIIEDALVINESCACEIIKAAITAANADATLVGQIVQTGISVAPKMAGVITDCAAEISPSAAASVVPPVVESGKQVKNPLPVSPAPEEEDFSPVPSSIRGIYLMQPPAGGFLPRDPKDRTCDNQCVSPTQNVPNYP